MKYTKLGKTGLDISRICLGCMSFGKADGWGHNEWALDEEESISVVRKALDSGINFFDTANLYSCGQSEIILGKALKKYANRDEVVIATKVWGKMREGANGAGLSRKSILAEVNHSLERLGVDYIDILYIHRWDYDTPIEETMSALNDLVRAGKVHYLGASAMFAWQFQKAQHVAEKNGWTKFSVMQGHYNLLYREEEREMNPLCFDQGVGLVPYSPLASGRLAREINTQTTRFNADQIAKWKYDSTEEVDNVIVERVGEIAKKHNVTRAQVSIAWLWEKGVDSPIVGITKEKYLDDFVAALRVKLTEDDIKYLDEPYVPHKVIGAR